jgi:uncharacterized damage-inducible protein DinB
MKSKSSKELIDILEQEVEKHLQDAIRIFQNLTPESLLKPSASGGWSIAQCLWHLNSYGEYYFPEIRKGLTKNYPFNPEFKSSWLGNYFTNTMKPGLKMKKYKAFKDHTPAPALDAHEVVAKFIQQQEELLDLLKLARHTDLNKVRIPISISRWLKLKLGDVFQFIIAHNERHLQQAKRNM